MKCQSLILKCLSSCILMYFLQTYCLLASASHTFHVSCHVIPVASVSHHPLNIWKSKAELNIHPVHSSACIFAFTSLSHPPFHLGFPHTSSFPFLLLRGCWVSASAANDSSETQPFKYASTPLDLFTRFYLVMCTCLKKCCDTNNLRPIKWVNYPYKWVWTVDEDLAFMMTLNSPIRTSIWHINLNANESWHSRKADSGRGGLNPWPRYTWQALFRSLSPFLQALCL